MITNSDGVLNYTDINVNKGGHAQIFCPLVDEESDSWGLGLSNVLETGEDQGIVFFTRNNRSGSHGEILGSGVAFVNTSSGKPVCSRPNGMQTSTSFVVHMLTSVVSTVVGGK